MSARSRSLLGIALLVGLLLGPGCGRDPQVTRWTRDHLAAERRLSQGDHSGALTDFERLERTAHFHADELDMRMRQAEAHRRAGRYVEAARILKAIEDGWNHEHAGRRGWDRERLAEVIYKRGRVTIDAGDVAGGESVLLAVVESFPRRTYGLRAWTYMRGRFLERDRDGLIEWSRKAYLRHHDTPLADNFLFEAARLYFERDTPDDDERAERLYDLFLERWRMETSGFWDDVIWDLSHIYHRRGRLAEEIKLLEDFLDTREETWLGSYELENYKHAHLRIARIYYEDRRDYARAAEWFAAFPTAFRYSILRDDALWWEAWSWQRAGQLDRARAAFARLARDYPESKYTRRVREGKPGP